MSVRRSGAWSASPPATQASTRVADFLLAWWNGPDNGHFPILHLCNCDATIEEDMIIIMAYLAQEPTVYPDAWGYRDAMVGLVERFRTREEPTGGHHG